MAQVLVGAVVVLHEGKGERRRHNMIGSAIGSIHTLRACTHTCWLRACMQTTRAQVRAAEARERQPANSDDATRAMAAIQHASNATLPL